MHSNFNELEQFVRSIMPGALKCVVRHQGKSEKVRTIHEFSSYMITLQNLKQRGFDFFCQNYVSSAKFSKEYLEHQVLKIYKILFCFFKNNSLGLLKFI